MARYHQSMSGYQEEYIRSGICLQTDMQYWNTVARTEIVRISDDYRNSVASLTRTIRERVEAGLTDRQDLLMMEVKLNEAEYQLLQARKNLENGLMALNSLIGVDLETHTEVEDSVAMVVADDVTLWSGVGSVRPELKIATEQIRMAESEKKIVQSKYRPQFYVGVDLSYSSPGYNFRTDVDPNYAIYATVSVPLFEWGKRKNEVRASAFKVDMATENLNRVTDSVNLEIRTARNSLRQAIKEELDFMSSYLFLHKVRLGDCINCDCRIPSEYMERQIPPLTLQLLVENVIKHNSISSGEPMTIHIEVDNGYLVVSNPVSPKKKKEVSSGIGLQNLSNRCRLMADKDISVRKEESDFTVKVPIIQ